jgi:hypothetical protein
MFKDSISSSLTAIPFSYTVPRKMTDPNAQTELIGQLLQLAFPQAGPIAVTAASIGGDEEFGGLGIARLTHPLPPPANTFHRKLRRIATDANIHPAFIGGEVKHPIGTGLALVFVRKIIGVHRPRLSVSFPFLARLSEVADIFLLGINRNHRLAAALKPLHQAIDRLELDVSIRMLCAFFEFPIRLQTYSPPPSEAHRRSAVRGDGLALEEPQQSCKYFYTSTARAIPDRLGYTGQSGHSKPPASGHHGSSGACVHHRGGECGPTPG